MTNPDHSHALALLDDRHPARDVRCTPARCCGTSLWSPYRPAPPAGATIGTKLKAKRNLDLSSTSAVSIKTTTAMIGRPTIGTYCDITKQAAYASPVFPLETIYSDCYDRMQEPTKQLQHGRVRTGWPVHHVRLRPTTLEAAEHTLSTSAVIVAVPRKTTVDMDMVMAAVEGYDNVVRVCNPTA